MHKEKTEFSKGIIVWIVILCWLGIIASFVLAFMGLETNDTVTVALITTILGSCVSYFLYQAKLKMSRNQYKIDEDGVPFNYKQKLNDEVNKMKDELISKIKKD